MPAKPSKFPILTGAATEYPMKYINECTLPSQHLKNGMHVSDAQIIPTPDHTADKAFTVTVPFLAIGPNEAYFWRNKVTGRCMYVCACPMVHD